MLRMIVSSQFLVSFLLHSMEEAEICKSSTSNNSHLFFDGDICGERGVLLFDGEGPVFGEEDLLGEE